MVGKVYKIIWSENSLSSLKKIHNYVHKKSPKGAKKLINTLVELGFSLQTFPERNPIDPWIINQQGNFRSLSKVEVSITQMNQIRY